MLLKKNEKSNNVSVLGTIKYVTNYDGFEPDAEGNFFPFELGEEATGDLMEFKKDGLSRYSGGWEKTNVLKVSPSQKWEILVDDISIVTFDFSETKFEAKH